MPVITESIEIERDREAVFDFMMATENQTLWQQTLVEYEQVTPGEISKGTITKGATRVAGRRIEWTGEIVELEHPHRYAARSIDAPMDFHLTVTLDDLGGRTRVTFKNEVGELGGFFGKLADPIVTKMYERDVKSNLEQLKILLEH